MSTNLGNIDKHITSHWLTRENVCHKSRFGTFIRHTNQPNHVIYVILLIIARKRESKFLYSICVS